MWNLCIRTRLACFYCRKQCEQTNSWSVWKEVEAVSQKVAFHSTFSPSPHRRWTSLILSADLQMPLQLQSNEATQMFPAWAFHSQSAPENNLQINRAGRILFDSSYDSTRKNTRDGKKLGADKHCIWLLNQSQIRLPWINPCFFLTSKNKH